MSVEKLPLVSVAVITYNQKEFLCECIESILIQDYPNLEIVIADDGSTDGTQDMLREYGQKYSDKFVLKLAEKNQGITANSNAAHFACTGKYIAWMGGDDLMLPGKISKQVTYMEATPDCTICYHDLEVFDSDTKSTLFIFSRKFKPREGDVRVALRYGCFNGACSTMVRANRCPEKGFNVCLPVASDWCYWVETLGNGGTINYIDDILGKYRRHAGNVTNPNREIGQNTVDHLNSCNFLLAKYPEYLNDLYASYSITLRSVRKQAPYFPVLLLSLKIKFDLKTLFAMMVFLASFGFIRL